MEFTVSVYSDLLCCIVRRSKKIPPTILPFVIFDVNLWTALFVITVICFWMWVLLRWVNLKMMERTREVFELNLPTHLANKGFFVQMRQLFIDTLMIMMSVPMKRLTRSKNERMLVGCACLVSLIFVSMFQSFMATVFTRPIYYKNITNLDELDKSGLLIYSNYKGFLDDAFPKNISKTYDNLFKKLKITRQGDANVKMMVSKNKASTLTRKSLYDLYWKYENFNLVKECPKKYNLAYITPKNSVYLERFNLQLLYMRAGGLINKFIQDINYRSTLENTIHHKNVEFFTNFKVFTMMEMQMPFIFLLFGFLVSFLVLFGEFRWNRRKRFI